MPKVIDLCSALDQEVVDVNFHTSPDQTPEYVVDQELVGRPYVLELERYHPITVSSLVGNEGGLFFIAEVHTDLIVSGVSVYE